MLEFGERAEAALSEDVLGLRATSAMEGAFRLVCLVGVDSAVRIDATASELTIILHGVDEGI